MGLLDPNHKDSSQPKTVILDVRETPEHATGRIPTSLPIPRGVLEGTVDSIGLDRSTPLVIYCAGGFRSVLAAETLQRMGFTRVQSLRGGMKAWREAGGPVTQGTGQE
ncbi:Rhodanese-like domain-containing protein [Piptocephalis cylindrospora]|uniref:Rhodanese-like domain-containing protein n=1 Tax=Piptocephalis cylindrospora TaxID=1907219 RepID=A0A4P9Y000_9FUNG|nr:Rhodanese-like domain-containing protein [Piptocephalis cylindrospora]|eukprot:RKP12073.1 Rhodanese-like domain-containing protein [Piptocephalis cylindrospora]